eukprot:SAG31_NODE_7420_length_1693_cov_1.743413_1_plen_49_part_10
MLCALKLSLSGNCFVAPSFVMQGDTLHKIAGAGLSSATVVLEEVGTSGT